MTKHARRSTINRFGIAPLSLLAGLVATTAVALSTTGTLAAFTASIGHSSKENTGTLVMQETSGSMTCTSTDGSGNGINNNAASCTGINHYTGATIAPGGSTNTTVSIKNVGTVRANSFTITFGACTQTNDPAAAFSGTATDICTRFYLGVNVTINGTTTAMTASSITLDAAGTNGTYTLPAVPAGATASVYFGVGLGSAIGNGYQGLTATQPITFQFGT